MHLPAPTASSRAGGRNRGMSLRTATPLTATHGVTAIVTEIAVAVSYGNAATVVTARSIDLEASELFGRSLLPGPLFMPVLPRLGRDMSVAVAARGGDLAETRQQRCPFREGNRSTRVGL